YGLETGGSLANGCEHCWGQSFEEPDFEEADSSTVLELYVLNYSRAQSQTGLYHYHRVFCQECPEKGDRLVRNQVHLPSSASSSPARAGLSAIRRGLLSNMFQIWSSYQRWTDEAIARV